MMQTQFTNISSDLWEAYRQGLYRFVLKHVQDAAAVDDIVQTALTKIVANVDSLRDQQKLRQWMYQITRNTIIDYYRTNQQHAALPDHLPSTNDPYAVSVEQELADCCIRPFIAKLPDKYRRAVTLSEIEGLTQKEVANQEGISLSGAKSRVQRGRRMLKEQMLACCDFEQDRSGRITNYHTTQEGERC